MGRSADGQAAMRTSGNLRLRVRSLRTVPFAHYPPLVPDCHLPTCPSAYLPTCPLANWKSAPVIGHNGSAAAVIWHFFSESMEVAAAPKHC